MTKIITMADVEKEERPGLFTAVSDVLFSIVFFPLIIAERACLDRQERTGEEEPSDGRRDYDDQ